MTQRIDTQSIGETQSSKSAYAYAGPSSMDRGFTGRWPLLWLATWIHGLRLHGRYAGLAAADFSD